VPWHRNAFLRAFALSALLIGGCFWLAFASWPGGLFIIVPMATVGCAIVIGLQAHSLVQEQRDKLAAMRFEALRRKIHDGVERDHRAHRT
jgi:hypothetical protein